MKYLPIAFLSLSLVGCSGLSLQARYDAYGVYGAKSAVAEKRAKSADEVAVFIGTSPEGFTLRDNELAVESGYDHQILGQVKVIRDGGLCDVGVTNKDGVIKAIQRKAWDVGGSAVVYAHSELPDDPTYGEACRILANAKDFGGGWVVVLGANDADPTQTTPPAI
jgi:hypothetical protein